MQFNESKVWTKQLSCSSVWIQSPNLSLETTVTMPNLTLVLFLSTLLFSSSFAFQSDELLLDDEEFGLEGGSHPRSPEPVITDSPPKQTPSIRRRYSDPDLDSKIQFTLEHAFGDSDFSSAGTFSARLKTWSHGGQVCSLCPHRRSIVDIVNYIVSRESLIEL